MLNTDREMSVIIYIIKPTTYLNDNDKTPLGRFVVYMLYSQLCNKHSDISNRWSLGLSLSVATSAVGAISSPSSTTLLIAVNGRVYFKRGFQPKCVESKTKNVKSIIEKCVVQNRICILQETRYFEPQLISFKFNTNQSSLIVLPESTYYS